MNRAGGIFKTMKTLTRERITYVCALQEAVADFDAIARGVLKDNYPANSLRVHIRGKLGYTPEEADVAELYDAFAYRFSGKSVNNNNLPTPDVRNDVASFIASVAATAVALRIAKSADRAELGMPVVELSDEAKVRIFKYLSPQVLKEFQEQLQKVKRELAQHAKDEPLVTKL